MQKWLILAICSCAAEPSAVSLPQADIAIESRAEAPLPRFVSESVARRYLAAQFRGAGLRILADVKGCGSELEVTFDGCDPERKIGYEYVAAAEESVAPLPHMARTSTMSILVVHWRDVDSMAARVAAFLRDAGVTTSPP